MSLTVWLYALAVLVVALAALCIYLYVSRDSESEQLRDMLRNREMLLAQLRQNVQDLGRATESLRAKVRRDLGNLHRLRLHWQGLRASQDPIAGHPVACTCRWCLFDASLTLLTDRAEYTADERAAAGKQLERESRDLYNEVDRGDRG